jgi:hypothetical protein
MASMLAARGLAPDEKMLAAAEIRPVTKATRWTAGLKKGQAAAVVKWVKVPGLVGKNSGQAKRLLGQLNLSARLSGKGDKVASQFPSSGEKVREFSTVKLLLDLGPPLKLAAAKGPR